MQFARINADHALLLIHGESQVRRVEQPDLARLTDDIQRVNADEAGVDRPGDIKRPFGDLSLGVDLDVELTGLSAQHVDRDDLPTILFLRQPSLEAGLGGDIEDAVVLGDRDSQLGDFPAQDFVGEDGIGVDQSILDANAGVVGDAGQEVHLGLAGGLGAPAGGDVRSRTQVGLKAGLHRSCFGGDGDQAGGDFDGLVGLGDHNLERGDAGGGDIEAELAALGGGVDAGGQFEDDLLLAGVSKEQRVVAIAGSLEQDFLACFELADGRSSEANGDFDPRCSEDVHGQFRSNASQVFLHRRDISGAGDDRRDRWRSGRSLLGCGFETFVLIQRKDHAGPLAVEDPLEELERQVNLARAIREFFGPGRGSLPSRRRLRSSRSSLLGEDRQRLAEDQECSENSEKQVAHGRILRQQSRALTPVPVAV